MSKRKKSRSKKPQNSIPEFITTRRGFLTMAGGLGVAIAGGSAVHAYDKRQRQTHDLSVIGSGVPSLIQIHDPDCPTCRRLKSRVTSALKGKDGIAYRLADITRPEGKALQNKYDVPHVTLLWFDGDGRLVDQSTGLLSEEEIAKTAESVSST